MPSRPARAWPSWAHSASKPLRQRTTRKGSDMKGCSVGRPGRIRDSRYFIAVRRNRPAARDSPQRTRLRKLEVAKILHIPYQVSGGPRSPNGQKIRLKTHSKWVLRRGRSYWNRNLSSVRTGIERTVAVLWKLTYVRAYRSAFVGRCHGSKPW